MRKIDPREVTIATYFEAMPTPTDDRYATTLALAFSPKDYWFYDEDGAGYGKPAWVPAGEYISDLHAAWTLIPEILKHGGDEARETIAMHLITLHGNAARDYILTLFFNLVLKKKMD